MKILGHLVTKVAKSTRPQKRDCKTRPTTMRTSDNGPQEQSPAGSTAGCYFGSQTAHSRQKLRENGHSWNLIIFLTKWSQKLAKLMKFLTKWPQKMLNPGPLKKAGLNLALLRRTCPKRARESISSSGRQTSPIFDLEMGTSSTNRSKMGTRVI